MNETPTPAGIDETVTQTALPGSGLMTRARNHRFAGAFFERKFGRLPLPTEHPAATVNDLIFNRMIDLRWSPLERAFVDKEMAKRQVKRLAPALRMPETLAVILMEAVGSVSVLHGLLQPFVGAKAVAKPTHSSGATVFLGDAVSSEDLLHLYQVAVIDYASIMREMQYARLPRKIIVETTIPTSTGGSPDDYKFHCVYGQPLVYQVDHDRFGVPWSRMFRVPGSDPMYHGDGLETPDTYTAAAPERLQTMVSAAQTLSASFDYVRVDLYNGSDGVYFGELTFTPAASLGVAPSSAGDQPDGPAHQVYNQIIMDAFARQRPSAASMARAR